MKRQFTVDEAELEFKLGENSLGLPVIAFRQYGKFLFQMQFSPEEFERCRKFFNGPYSGRVQ